MIIFRTHQDHVDQVVRRSLHALESSPKRLLPGDLILISQTVGEKRNVEPRIRWVMKFVKIYRDSDGETEKIWGRRWKYIVHAENCRRLTRPFDIRKIKVSDHEYGRGGPYMYVVPEDELAIRQQGLLI